MTDQFVRHFVAAVATIMAGLIYFAGYVGGQNNWWWAGFAVIGVYLIFYNMITAGGGHH